MAGSVFLMLTLAVLPLGKDGLPLLGKDLPYPHEAMAAKTLKSLPLGKRLFARDDSDTESDGLGEARRVRQRSGDGPSRSMSLVNMFGLPGRSAQPSRWAMIETEREEPKTEELALVPVTEEVKVAEVPLAPVVAETDVKVTSPVMVDESAPITPTLREGSPEPDSSSRAPCNLIMPWSTDAASPSWTPPSSEPYQSSQYTFEEVPSDI